MTQKISILFILFFLHVSNIVWADETSNPVAHFTSLGEPSPEVQARYTQVGFKKISVDINGAGELDVLLCFDDPESDDATEAQSREQAGGALAWDVYIRSYPKTILR